MSMRPPNKRRIAEPEELMDDMAVAAAYAAVTAPVVPAAVAAEPTTQEEVDEDPDAIDLDEPVTDKGDANDGAKVNNNINTESDPEEEDDGDESDVDLAAELAQIEKAEEDGRNRSSGKPMSEHEVDAYQTADLKALESATGLSLTVQPKDYSAEVANRLCPAGKVQHHMVDDRTLIIASQLGSVLEEGTLLVLQLPHGIVPLGKIFEVFGPVSQPLYSIRFAEELPEEHGGNDEKKEEPTQTVAGADKASAAKAMDTGAKEQPKEQTDVWGQDGKYTKLLQGSRNLAVYYVQDRAALVDTAVILRQSGRGCDASNLYDEEVINPKEMYFSDDEQERQAKGKGKKKGRNDRQRSDQGQRQQGQPFGGPPPHGFHSGVPMGAIPPSYSHSQQGYQQGFQQQQSHYQQQQPAYPQGYQPQAYQQAYPQPPYIGGYAGPPPPPPPPAGAYPYPAAAAAAPPPPPPKDNSDTVYYDYS